MTAEPLTAEELAFLKEYPSVLTPGSRLLATIAARDAEIERLRSALAEQRSISDALQALVGLRTERLDELEAESDKLAHKWNGAFQRAATAEAALAECRALLARARPHIADVDLVPIIDAALSRAPACAQPSPEEQAARDRAILGDPRRRWNLPTGPAPASAPVQRPSVVEKAAAMQRAHRSQLEDAERCAARQAVEALRTPDASLAKVPNTVRQSIADVIEGQQRTIETIAASAPVQTPPSDALSECLTILRTVRHELGHYEHTEVLRSGLKVEDLYTAVDDAIRGYSTAPVQTGSERMPDGWRPISEAPRDGTNILLFTTSHGVVEAWFCSDDDGSNWICADDAFQIEVEEWPNKQFGDGPATHWMLLPAAPATPEPEPKL